MRLEQPVFRHNDCDGRHISCASHLEAGQGVESSVVSAASTLNMEQFMEYIYENFNISGEAQRLIFNILFYVQNMGLSQHQQYEVLTKLLDGTIGLSDAEIKRICL